MATIFSIPINYQENKEKDIYSLLKKMKELQYQIERNWSNLSEDEREKLIKYYYKIIDRDFTLWEKFSGSIDLAISTLKYGIQPVLEFANETYNLLNLISDKIERENPEYQKMLEQTLADDNISPIGNIDEFIKSLESETK